MSNETQNTQPNLEPAAPAENPMIKKRWFGRGIYASKDVPIRILDACIGAMIIAALALTIWGRAAQRLHDPV